MKTSFCLLMFLIGCGPATYEDKHPDGGCVDMQEKYGNDGFVAESPYKNPPEAGCK